MNKIYESIIDFCMKKLSQDTNKVLHDAVEKGGTIFFTANLTYRKKDKDEKVRFDHSIVWGANQNKCVVTAASGKDTYSESLEFVLKQFIAEESDQTKKDETTEDFITEF